MMPRKSPNRPEVLAQWSRLPVRDDASSVPEATQTRVVHAIARTMVATAARRTARALRIRWAFAAVAAAALVLAGSTLSRSRLRIEAEVARLYARFGGSHLSVHAHEIVSPSAAGSAVAPGFDSQGATGSASSSRLELMSGIEIVVGPEARLTLPDTKGAPRFREELILDSGHIDVRVPKLQKGHFFGIRTPNALVSVHGTAFSVEVTRTGTSDVTRTRVVVTEGVVSVQHADHELLLDAGTEWTSSVADPAAAASDLPRTGAGKAVSESPSRRRSPRVGPEATAADGTAFEDAGTLLGARESPTELATQNALFSSAMSARDRGDWKGSVALLDEFCSRYPASPLTQDAYVARFRVLAQTGDHVAAARAARTYLALYAGGFAAAEARSLALGSDGGP